MSKSSTIGVVLGGVGGLMTGVAAAWPIFAPAPVKTQEDVLSELRRLTEALESRAITIDGTEIPQIETAVDNLTGRLAIAAQQQDGNLPFVPRSYAGVSDYTTKTPFDFAAPGGDSRLMRLDNNRTRWIDVFADGDRVGRLTPGENLDLTFGDQTCTFELIAIPETDAGILARIRSRCA